MSGLDAFAAQASRTSAKSAPTKRVWHASSAASSSKRSAAAGSRSMQISAPVRAEPLGDRAGVAAAAEGAVDGGLARPRVEQVDQLGGRGRGRARRSSGSVSPTASRALAPAAITRRLRSRGSSDIRSASASSSASCSAQRSAFQISRYSSTPITTQGPQAGVLDQRLGHAHAPGRVERLVEGAAVEAAAQHRAPSRPKGLCGERKRSESSSNSSGV